jgi:hypothetical protein
MTRSRTAMVRGSLLLLALLVGFLALLTRPSQATTRVFDNYTHENCECGNEGPAFVAAGFMLTFGAVDAFAGAAVYVQKDIDSEKAPQPFSIALYSSTSDGAPGSAPLWTSKVLFTSGEPNSAALIGEAYAGPEILLLGGKEYFLALNMSAAVDWLDEGPHPTPFYSTNDGISWRLAGAANAQFQIYGDIATTPIPEASTWAMMAIGFAGLGWATARRKGRIHAIL